MKNNESKSVHKRLLPCLFIFGLTAALIYLPYQFNTSASSKQIKKGLLQRTESHEEGLENYDIRADKSATEKIVSFRQAQNKDAAFIADLRSNFAAGEESLKSRVPTLKVEYNTDIRTPEIIAPDVKQGRAFLTQGSTAKRSDILRSFVKENTDLIGVTDAQADSLKVTADYTNPDGNLSFAQLEQFINGIPVFRGEVKAGFNKEGRMIRAINNLAPGLENASLSTDFRDPFDAVKAAAGFIDLDSAKLDLNQNASVSNDLKAVFGNGDFATVAEKMYFPTEPGVAVPAWRVLIWQPVNAFYVIVDAETGTMLWRKNITEDQTQPATFNVYTNPNAMINVADNPFPLSPGPLTPNGQQGAALNRSLVTRVGNEAPYSFNNNGWISDGGNETDGNANEAGLDRDPTDGVDTTNGRAAGTNRVFNFPVNPLNPNTNTGDSPVPAGETASGCATIPQPHGMVDAQRAAVTQLFYINNWYHDELYRLGFTEQAFNFQHSNFGRGGAESDRVSAQAQDCSGVNNANFSTPADGTRGRMQMYLWTGPNPDLDGDFDAEVVIHEHTHGLSNRLHGNASGLSGNMSRGMGEGWSDFYAHSLLSEPTDPINGIYTAGGYDTYLINAGFTNNYYYGIRRYPKAVIGFTGGTNNRPHNAYTFNYINADCNGRLNNFSFAFSRGPVGSSICDQVHNIGEVWSSMLWEVRARFVQRLGWADGNRRMLQYVTDGMKLAPLNPTFIQERDAIIAAAQATLTVPQTSQDVADIWEGFRLRGLGFSAVVNNAGSGANDTAVTEAFDTPNLYQKQNITISDSSGDGDGFPEPGERILINVPLTNSTGDSANNVTAQIVGGGTANYGTILNNATVAQPIDYTVPANTACGTVLNLTININSSLGATNVTRIITIGVPQTIFSQNFDGVTSPALPAGWTSTLPTPPTPNNGQNWVTTTSLPASAPNAAFNPEMLTPSLSDLESPTVTPTASGNVRLKFNLRYATEASYDGAVLEIKIGGGAYQDIVTAGGSFITGGYNSFFATNSDNPIEGRSAWTGSSDGYSSVYINLPASVANQAISFRWRNASDTAAAIQGVSLDDVQIINGYTCQLTPNIRSRVDFDGDGKTDMSVFRPSEGNWYLNRSTAGFNVVNWGISTDTLLPGDYDGDGKTDTAVFRPSATPGVADFYILNSSNLTVSYYEWGSPGDVPLVFYHEGSAAANIAVWRPSNGNWYIRFNNGSAFVSSFGLDGDRPVVMDADGDGRSDRAVFRPSTNDWYIWMSQTSDVVTVRWGATGDVPVPADYDGDNKDDIAIYRPSTGAWWVLRSSDGAVSVTNFGIATDKPVPGDYDGDGRDDQAIYRHGTWWLNQSTAGVAVANFGLSTDSPVPAAYLP